MTHQLRYSLLLLGLVTVAACSDTGVQDPITGVARLNAGQGTTHCNGTLPPGAYANVIVLPDAICEMHDVTVERDVSVLPRGSLLMTNFDIGGDLRGTNAGQIIVQNGSVGNDVDIKGGAFSGPGAFVHTVVVEHGDIVIENMETGLIFAAFNQVPQGRIYVANNTTQFFLQIAGNTVGRTIEVSRNAGPSPKVVDSNTAGEAIRCMDNEQPFVGGPNVAPEREGQCF
jgi:hypothetical protein